MKFPVMNKRPRQAVSIPELRGGLNLRDSVSMVNDNQLTECKNMWFSEGALRTRPGIADTKYYYPVGEGLEWPEWGRLRPHEIYVERDNKRCRLFSGYSENSGKISFFFIGEDYFEALPIPESTDGNHFAVKKDEIIYCYKADGVYKCELNAEEISWVKIAEEEMYAPTIAIDCKVDGINFNGVMYESYNLLCDRYKLIYSTVNPNHKPVTVVTEGVEEETNELHEMTYFNVIHEEKYEKYADCIIKATITDKFGKKHYHSIILGADGNGEEKEEKEDGLKMKGNINGISFLNGYDVVRIYKNSEYIKNNLEIEFPIIWEEKSKNKVLNMSRCAWFGGDSAGINGGTRLFLGGNSEEPNLVVWSDLNNPLYFPENNYFYVGEADSAVTAFGKQQDMLVIFKENETYYTQYNRNTNISAENLINQSVVDYVGSSVYFPLVLINSRIGCDCPDTVQLCRNRLVWVCSDGKVYTLVTNNQYSERNIYEIGEMVSRALSEDKKLKGAVSADWNGHYILQSAGEIGCGSTIYLMDYNSYGYQFISSFSKNEDANIRIPWYIWRLEPHLKRVDSMHFYDTLTLAEINGELLCVSNWNNEALFVSRFSQSATVDDLFIKANPITTDYFIPYVKPIKGELQTKLFEFGAQGYLKNVDKVVLSLGDNGGVPIRVEFITSDGCEEEYVTPESDGEGENAYSTGYVRSVPLSPCIRAVERFGVRMSCEGPLA
ncbi:MAG: hypothetical protein IKK13_02120, partial [Clostridia bacterium]|nr:hypothetical protein [Clostridia bacterium]